MRHQKSGRKFSRTSAHRKAMFSNMVASLMIHERIETTEAKANELKRLADHTITWGTSVAELTSKGRDKLDAAEKARIVHAMRMAQRMVKSPEALDKLFGDIAHRFKGRPGGYTRVMKTRIRRGDATPMSFVELVTGATPPPAPAPVADEPAPAKPTKAKAKAPAAEPKAPKAAKAEAAEDEAPKAKAKKPAAPKPKK